jgi:hypothetical protein
MLEQKWTPEMVADRVKEAAMTLRVLRVSGLKPKGYGSNWPDVVHDPNEAFGWNATEVRMGPPTPGAISRMDEVMDWLRWLEPDYMRIVWLHAEGVNRKIIQIKLGVGKTKLRAMWMSALMTIASMLNRTDCVVGQPANDHEEAFRLEYRRTRNASEAYRKVFNCDGLSDVALRSRAFRLAKKVGTAQQTQHYSTTNMQQMQHIKEQFRR